MRKFIVSILLLGLITPPVWALRLSVSAPIANVRANPTTESKVLWQVGKYQPIEVTETVDEWHHIIDQDKDTGWLHQKLVCDTKTVITVAKCHVRSNPSEDSPIVFAATVGVPFMVLEQKGLWIKIEHEDGSQGWIPSSVVW